VVSSIYFKDNNLLEANHDDKHWLDLQHLLKQPAFIYCSIEEFNARVLRMRIYAGWQHYHSRMKLDDEHEVIAIPKSTLLGKVTVLSVAKFLISSARCEGTPGVLDFYVPALQQHGFTTGEN
jgi:hypothetical protein